MDKPIINRLIKILGKEHITTTDEDLLSYSYDATGKEFPPEVVVFPGNAFEISKIMKLAQEHQFPVVPRGAGTGMTGGALAVQGGLLLAMSRFNRIIEIDALNHVAVVEPGVITGDFQKEVKKQGLFYPPDPASAGFCSMGGNVAECAGGPSAVKYGVTRDYILGLEVVLPDGRVINTGTRTAKGVVGYDLTRLIVGSEGTLGIITKITLKLLASPPHRATFLILTDSMFHAAGLVAEILAHHTPCTLEFMDRTAIGIVSPSLPFSLAQGTQALLLLELDGDPRTVEIESAGLMDFLRDRRGVLEIRMAKDPKEADTVWAARRTLSPAAYELKPHKINEDVAVPRSKIPDLVSFIEKLAHELGIIIFTFGHAGDGNIHVNIMIDRNDPEELRKGSLAKEKLFSEVIRLGGTLSGEHGIGITKADFLHLEIDATTLAVMKSIKKLFDPKNILNPGKIFPALDKKD